MDRSAETMMDGALETQPATIPAAVGLRGRILCGRMILPLVVAGVSFYFVFRHLDVQAMIAIAGRMHLRYYVAGFALFYLSIVLRGVRWQLLLANLGLRKSMPDATRVLFLSWFVNCIVPAKLGDLYRCHLVRRRHQFPAAETLGSVAVERIFDLVAAAGLMSLSGLVLFGRTVPDYFWHLVAWSLLLTGVLVGTVICLSRKGDRLEVYLPARWVAPFRGFCEGLAGSGKRIPLIVGMTALVWALEAARLFCTTRAVGLSIPTSAVIFAALAASLLTTLPITVAGLGVVEGAIVAMLLLLNVDQPTATFVALLDRSVSYWSILVVGLPLFLFAPER